MGREEDRRLRPTRFDLRSMSQLFRIKDVAPTGKVESVVQRPKVKVEKEGGPVDKG